MASVRITSLLDGMQVKEVDVRARGERMSYEQGEAVFSHGLDSPLKGGSPISPGFQSLVPSL